jgi:hypothetical protein
MIEVLTKSAHGEASDDRRKRAGPGVADASTSSRQGGEDE